MYTYTATRRHLLVLLANHKSMYEDDGLFIWLFNLLTMSLPDEGYSRNPSCKLTSISTCLLCYTITILFLFI